MSRKPCCGAGLLTSALVIGMACPAASAAVSLLGVQYVQDNVFPEYACLWHHQNYPPEPCPADIPGSHAHVFLKNDGASSVSIDDVTLAGYSLSTVIKYRLYNDHPTHSIHHYWLNPPQTIIDAGEPVWFKGDPATIPAGGVGQAIIRLRWVPTTPTISVGVVTSGGTINTTVPVDADQPELASVGFSEDLTKVHLHWRRSGGAAPTTIKMDGTDVTANTVTVGDANTDFAVSIISLGTAVTEMSYHVFQGIYADSAVESAGLRTRANPMMYGTWHSFVIADNDYAAGEAWVDTCEDRGINALIMQASGGLADYFQTSAGRQHAADSNYRFVIDYLGKFSCNNPMLWFLDDEPDIEENTVLNNFCNDTQYKIPCGSDPTGIMATHFISEGEARRGQSNSPTTINMNGTYKPRNYYAYGQAVDSLMIDCYYEKRVMDSHLPDRWPNTLDLYRKATVIHATSLAGTRASEPNPFNILLFSCEAHPSGYDPWPFSSPQAKRTEVYYALSGGAKGIGYWWFKPGNPSNGLGDQADPRAQVLWKEIGLLGAEIKTLTPYLATACPVDLDAQGSTDVWVRGLARGTDMLMLFVVNDNHWNDQDWHGTDTLNATVTVTLPDWMQSPAPTAFEVSAAGLKNVTTDLTGDELELSIGTLSVARLFIVTTDPLLRMTIQDRYDNETWPGVCNFASDVGYEITDPPTIVQHPSNKSVLEGESATFVVTASGGSQFSFQWQKNGSNLSDGGHYSGCTTFALTVSNCDSSDEASYRCVVTNPYGSATTNEATLTLSTVTITQQPTAQSVCPGSSAQFTVAATGEGTLTYRWQKNQVDLNNGGHYSGVTTATLNVSNVDSSDVADYRCTVTDNNSTIYSDEAALTIRAGASITQQPSSQLVELGETAEFTVAATGTGTLTYQWQKDQVDLSNGGHYSGCTTAMLTVSNVDSSDEADYRCVVTDDCGSANSDDASLIIDVCGSDITVQNGDFESGFTGSSPNQVANGWTKYMIGGVFNEAVFTSASGNPDHAQRMDYTKTRNNRYYGMYQTIDSNTGDAFSFAGQVWCLANGNIANCSLRVDWAGGTNPGTAIQVTNNAGAPDRTWIQLSHGGGTATGNSVTLFADVRAYGDSNVDTDTYWDNIVAYRTHVPPAPAVSSAGSTSLDVNVNPGCNLANSNAEYAISIGGGAYTLGTHWVQSDGTVGTTAVWQTDATWATTTVTGLVTGTTYTLKVKARYSSAYTQETSLGAGADGTPEGGCTPPEAPTDNTPEVLSATSIRWRWIDQASETGYRVRDTGGADKSGLLAANTIQWAETIGLAPNTQYTRHIHAVNACGESDPSAGQIARTLSAPPDAGSITPSTSDPGVGEDVIWTAVGGFGAGTIQYYRYAWDQSPTYNWIGSEPQWSSGTITTSPTTSGTWYLHVQGYNADDVANGTYDYSVTAGGVVIVEADLDGDGDVDMTDFGIFQVCFGELDQVPTSCQDSDFNSDDEVDAEDLSTFLQCLSGESIPADPDCAD